MCGRYVLTDPDLLRKRYGLDIEIEDLSPNYNVAPGALMPVITEKPTRMAEAMKWGLIPHWAKESKIGYKMINARAESVAEKPSIKRPFAMMRCLVPANGFYEWERQNSRIPYYFHQPNDSMFSFAGLYDVWQDPEGYPIKTFTIITTPANEDLLPIHNRMPVVLPSNQEELWLANESTPDELKALLKPPALHLEKYPVSRSVNSPVNNSSELLSPAQ